MPAQYPKGIIVLQRATCVCCISHSFCHSEILHPGGSLLLPVPSVASLQAPEYLPKDVSFQHKNTSRSCIFLRSDGGFELAPHSITARCKCGKPRETNQRKEKRDCKRVTLTICARLATFLRVIFGRKPRLCPRKTVLSPSPKFIFCYGVQVKVKVSSERISYKSNKR